MALINGYYQSDNECEIEIINLDELEEKAKEILPIGGFNYVCGGSEDNWTLKQNREAFNKIQIVPRILTGVENPNTRTTLLGENIEMPIIVAPAAAHGLMHSRAELATAEGTKEAGTIYCQSTYSTKNITETLKAGNGGPQYFQLYLSNDWDLNEEWIKEAELGGVKALVITVDAMVGGYREAAFRHRFDFPITMGNLEKLSLANKDKSINEICNEASKISITKEDIKKVMSMTKLPVMLKGIQDVDDAKTCLDLGVQGIWVSNHGGRQLNGGPAAIDTLKSISEVINKRIPIIFDSGVRRGSHVFKALASGADVVSIARPVLYGLALGGSTGVKNVLEHLNKELKITMILAGADNIENIKNSKLIRY